MIPVKAREWLPILDSRLERLVKNNRGQRSRLMVVGDILNSFHQLVAIKHQMRDIEIIGMHVGGLDVSA